MDELGRPVVWPNCSESLRETEMECEKEERRRRVVSYLKNSNMSLVEYDTNCREISLNGIEVCFDITWQHRLDIEASAAGLADQDGGVSV